MPDNVAQLTRIHRIHERLRRRGSMLTPDHVASEWIHRGYAALWRHRKRRRT